MRGRLVTLTVACFLAVAGTGLAQLRPALLSPSNVLASEVDLPASSQMQMDMSGPADQGIPSYHAYALRPPIPATLDPKQFPDALNRNVYAMAGKVKPVLYQQPCYCYCDRSGVGHKSLLDCFASMHGTQCDICQKEAVFAYLQTQKGKTPSQIRTAIVHGDWKSLDLRAYMIDLPAPR